MPADEIDILIYVLRNKIRAVTNTIEWAEEEYNKTKDSAFKKVSDRGKVLLKSLETEIKTIGLCLDPKTNGDM